ncbi:TonB-dependent receptor domain-containing protein [Mucilaginibacter sp. FT3.2]|uniref:TonB-dependent receptor domain-containing protein n=1 Tax=Mucilaginibacter sp. FT3.2 TaxID=2723090 RepID=UPI001622A736|nr:TonB-dependent receptor [Mucilaginibacter sp. FT3.2]MBB6235049.1 outer membrane receptor protein involved in Fe transport [Mucilaginibacter sp. FT3.2]
MCKFLLFIFSCFLFTVTNAQTKTPANITVKGVAIDSVANKPLGYVTVVLQDAATKASVKSTLTKDDGSFELKVAEGKTYQITAAFIGYTSKIIAVKPDGGAFDAGKIFLSASSRQLGEVSVTAVRPVMKQEVDRLVYDVQADPESKQLSALDMMRKVPLLSVDASDNIKLRGSGNYKILLNGKESALMARNPSDILKAMPGINIVKIEVITTPPAKYDAEGLAGIINIITQKKADEGYNGSVNANYNSVFGYRTNVNATIKQGKLGFNGYIGHGERPQRSSGFFNQTDFFDPVTSLIQSGTRSNGNKNTYGSTELSFEADSLNLLTAAFNFYSGTGTQASEQFTTMHDSSGQTSYTSINNGNSDFHGADFGLNYQLSFKNRKEQLLTASYKYSNSGNRQFNDVTPGNAANYRQYNNAGSKEHTTQLDYVETFKTITLEAGGKLIARNNYSDFHNDVANGQGQYSTDTTLSNNFTYRQDVYSLYNSYTVKLTKWTLKGGVRYERTTINANFSETENLDQNFTNVVPSLSIQRSLKNSSLNFGFTQRIQRPGIFQLNPFADKSNPQYITVGNPGLKPSLNNNFELSYGNFAKGSVNISTSYSFANNTIQNLASVGPDAVTTTTFANVGKNQTLGLDVNINYPITTKLNININAELLKVWLKGTYKGTFFTNSGQQGHIFTNSGYKFDNGYRIGLNVGFDSRYVLLQGTDNYYLGYGANVSKELFKKKANLFLNIGGPFAKFNKLDFYTRTPDFKTYSYNYNYYRSIGIGFNYKFGKLNGTIKKNQRGINNDDTSSSSKN